MTAPSHPQAPSPAGGAPARPAANRRVVLAWKWGLWSVVALGATTGLALWIAREDTRPVDPGSRDVKGLTDELARRLPPDCPKLRFVDHGPRLGLPPQFVGPRTHQLPEDMGGGVAAADFDGDGDADVLLVGCGALDGPGAPTRLFRNDTPSGGAVALTDATSAAGLPGPLHGMGAAVADVDADGDLDLLVTHLKGARLLRNAGGLRFEDVTDAAGLGNASDWCSGAAFGDLDGDGDLDLYVSRYVEYREAAGQGNLRMYGRSVPPSLNPSSFRPLRNLVYLNRGDGTFEGGEAAAVALGIDSPEGRSLQCVVADFDLDGLPDVYVANDVSDNAMYQGVRREDGTRGFRDRSYDSATADYRGAMGLAVADADGDGDDEIHVTHWIAQENALYRNRLRDARMGGTPMLFTDVADQVGLGAVSLDYVGWATDFADFDLDGRPDLFAANGSTLERDDDRTTLVPQRPLFFWNGGPAAGDGPDRGFFEPGAAWGEDLAKPRGFRGGSVADLDGDGDPDLVLGALEGAPAVLVNEGPPRGRSLAVDLRAAGPNTFGIGARVTVSCGGHESSREMRSSPSYQSAGPPVLLFGLGAAKGPATVRVRWPDGESTEATAAPDVPRLEVRRP